MTVATKKDQDTLIVFGAFLLPFILYCVNLASAISYAIFLRTSKNNGTLRKFHKYLLILAIIVTIVTFIDIFIVNLRMETAFVVSYAITFIINLIFVIAIYFSNPKSMITLILWMITTLIFMVGSAGFGNNLYGTIGQD